VVIRLKNKYVSIKYPYKDKEANNVLFEWIKSNHLKKKNLRKLPLWYWALLCQQEYSIVKELLAHVTKADLEKYHSAGATFELMAVRFGRHDILKHLIEKGLLLDNSKLGPDQISPAYLAFKYNQTDVLSYLFYEIKINLPDFINECLTKPPAEFFYKSTEEYNNYFKRLEALISSYFGEKKYPFSQEDKNTILQNVLKNMYYYSAEFILMLINAGAELQITDFMRAIQKNDENNILKIIQCLWEKGYPKDKLLRTDTHQASLLYYAVSYDKPAVVKFLIDNGADWNIPFVVVFLDFYGINKNLVRYMTLILCAVEAGHLEVVKLFCSNPENTVKALLYAAINGQLNIIKYLIEECHVNVNVVNEYGETPLHLVLQYAQNTNNDVSDEVKYLVEKGANVSIASIDDGLTPLHFAAMIDDLELFKLLTGKNKKNINIHCKTINPKAFYGVSPLHEAIVNGHYGIAKFLINWDKSLIEGRSNWGNTLLHTMAELHYEKS
jgi:ankyrin repeat protein